MSWSKKSTPSTSSSFASFASPINDIKLGLRVAQVVGVTAASALAGANLSLSFIVVPRLLESPPHLLLKQWSNAYAQGKAFFPFATVLSSGSFFFLAWKQTNKLKLKSYVAAGLLGLAIVPYTLFAMLPTNNKLTSKVEETQGLVYSDRDFDDEASSGTGRKHKSRSSKERSSKKSSSSSRKRSTKEIEEEVADHRTAHELVDHWAVLNVGRGLLLLASGVLGAWTVVS